MYRLTTTSALIAAATLLVPVTALPQQIERGVSVVSEDVAGQLEAFSYREGPVSKLAFRGTAIALAADGKVDVEFQDGRARVDVSVRKLPDVRSLGPYTTYVLWAVTIDGRASNLGAIETKRGRGELETSTRLSQFALIVTAEPHFAVTAPSKTVALRNLGQSVKGEKTMISSLVERMDYGSLEIAPVDPKGKTPLDLVQARYAVAIARAAHADQYAAAEFTRSAARLAEAEASAAHKKYRVRDKAPRLAREAVQMAEDARSAAVIASADAEQQRLAGAAATASAKSAKEAAETVARREAELAREVSDRRARDAALQAEAAAQRQARTDLVARLNRVLPTRETDRGVVAEIAGVQFATGAASLAMQARESLARFAGIVSIYPTMKFRIEGHTDSTGSDATNRALSLQRAIGVRDYLIGQGVPASRIDVAGLGPDRPVADNATADGRAANRRVEIVVTGGPASLQASGG